MRPATIQEFCGPGYLNERNVRPGIMAALIETFGEEVNAYSISNKRRALLTGAIGIGKSTYAAIALSYMVHWIKCLKNPKEFYNLSEDSVIGFMMMSTTEKLAQEVIFQKVKKRIQNSVWFQNWAPLAEENRRMQKQMRFEGDIWIVPGSSLETSFEGYDILGGIVDEGDSHNVTDTKDYAEAGYNSIESRIESRFTDFNTGQHRGLMICIGQAKRKGGFMLRHYEDFDKDPDSVAVRMTIWESFGWYNYTKDKADIKRGYETAERDSFYYDIRKRTLLSKEAAQVIMNKDLIEVPTQYRKSFERDPVKALRDLAGIPPEVDDPFISRPDFILDNQELWHERFPEYDSPVGTESRLDKIVLPDWFSPNSLDGPLRRVIHIDTAYCVDDLTEVLTQRGWLRYDQIEIGDKTLGLDPVTHKARWDRINKLNIFDYDGELNSLETEGHSSLTTDNHRWYVDQRKFNNETRRYDSLEPAVVMSKDLNTRHTIIGAAEVENLPTERTQRDETVELVGWFWTEGHINRCRRTGKQLDGIEISQSWRVNEDNCKRIEACLRGLFGDPVDLFTRGGCKAPVKPEWRMHKSGGNIRFYLNSWIGKRLKTLAPDRRPTFEFISSLTREQLELFVEVSELADRTKPGCIAQKDGKSLEAVQMAYVLLGRRTAIRVNGNDMTVLSSYRESRRKIKYKPEIHKRVSYKGIVWCPTTDTGSWLARRNGKTYFTGNSPEGDALGFAMAHVPEKIDQYGEERPVIVFDLLLRIKATPSVEINFGEIRKFIYSLRDDYGFEIDIVTIDGFNSFDFIQQLRRNKIKSDYLSVDKTKAPYEDLREAINDLRCLMPKYMVHYTLSDTKIVNIAYKELSEVQDVGKKIDHPKDGSKDVADAITGCVHTLVSFSKYTREARTVQRNQSEASKKRTVVTDANEMFGSPSSAMKGSLEANSPVSFEEFQKAQNSLITGATNLEALMNGNGLPGYQSDDDRIW
nr:MAG TPA: Large subunit terminase [Caudoviricetes sp.]